MAFDTALNIIADAAVELGLVSYASKPTVAFGSTDPNIGQLCQLLKSVGRDLMREHQWTQLQSQWLFSTTTNVGLYALPGDYDRVIDQTAWNRSNRMPLGGPISPQEWQFMKGRLVGITFNLLWRVLQGQFLAYPDDTTPGSYAIAYEYVSRWWVRPSGTSASTKGPWLANVTYATNDTVTSGGNLYKCTTGGLTSTTQALTGTGGAITDGAAVWSYQSVAGADVATNDQDTVLFDPQLVLAALKLQFRRAKGLDVAGAQADYDEAIRKAKTADVVAPVLYFNRPTFAEPLLGPWSLPISGKA